MFEELVVKCKMVQVRQECKVRELLSLNLQGRLELTVSEKEEIFNIRVNSCHDFLCCSVG